MAVKKLITNDSTGQTVEHWECDEVKFMALMGEASMIIRGYLNKAHFDAHGPQSYIVSETRFAHQSGVDISLLTNANIPNLINGMILSHPDLAGGEII